jgi:RNA polymerase sigma factor (sigma-70 family)
MSNSVAETFKLYRERLLKFIRSRVRLLEDAEDILQDVFGELARADDAIGAVKPVENAAAWLYRAARNRIIDHYRKKKDEPLPLVSDEEADDYIFDEIADILDGEAATPETAYLRGLFLDEIQTALDDLPEEQRTVFELTEIARLPVKAVAEKMHTPINTVLSRKHYAVKHLRKSLAELYADLIRG